MRKLTLEILSCLLLFSILSAQTQPTQTYMIGADIIGFLINAPLIGSNDSEIPSNAFLGDGIGHFSLLLNGGANEIYIPIFYWKTEQTNEYGAYNALIRTGIGLRYRIYTSYSTEGLFYGGGLSLMRGQFEGRVYHNGEPELHVSEETAISPTAEIGYRLTFKNTFSIAPSMVLGYTRDGIVENHDFFDRERNYTSEGVNVSFSASFAFLF